MWSLNAKLRTVVVISVVLFVSGILCQTEEEVRTLLNTYNIEAVDLCNAKVVADWDVSTNVGKNEFEAAQVNLRKCIYFNSHTLYE